MTEQPFEIFKTPIWGYVLKNEYYHISNYIDYLVEQQRTVPSVKKSNFGGYQTHDNLHEVNVFKEFVDVVQNISNNIFLPYSSDKLEIDSMWGNINNFSNSNASHVHEGVLSGVFYLKVPVNSGKLVFINPAVRSDGHLIRTKNYSIQPEFLSCIIFPSWLEHYVEPSDSQEDRISISFNLKKV